MKYKLKEIFDLHMGKTPSRNNAEYWNSNEYKWISIADLSKTGKYIRDTKEHLSKQAIDESGIKLIPANTVIMSFKLYDKTCFECIDEGWNYGSIYRSGIQWSLGNTKEGETKMIKILFICHGRIYRE